MIATSAGFQIRDGTSSPPTCPVCHDDMYEVIVNLNDGPTVHVCGQCSRGCCDYHSGWGYCGERIGGGVWTWKIPERASARRKRMRERGVAIRTARLEAGIDG